MIHALWWIPLTVIHTVLYSWIAVKCNGAKFFSLETLSMFGLGAIGLWMFVVHVVPKDKIVSSGIIYDVVLLTTFILSTSYFTGQLSNFSWVQWLGIAMAICGVFLIEL